MKVFSAQQMRDFDRAATQEYGIPSSILMENAALRVVEFLEAKFAPLEEKRILIYCGKGNNGGDGLAIARHLSHRVRHLVVMHVPWEQYKGDTGINAQVLSKSDGFGAQFSDWTQIVGEKKIDQFLVDFGVFDIAIDALFGTGFDGELREPIPAMLSALLWVPERISVDIFSGVNADTGVFLEPENINIGSADYTITFAAPKRGQFVRDGVEKSGEIWVGDIGTLPEQMRNTETGIETLDLETIFAIRPYRPIDAHKGDAGRVLVVGGCLGMSGSIAMASHASLQIGAGLCQAAIPRQIMSSFASICPEATSFALPDDSEGQLLYEALEQLPEKWKNVQAVALGPGIGRSDEVQKLVRDIVRQCPQTLVIDADALHALPAIADDVKKRKGDTILTPHPGEMGILMEMDAGDVNDNRFETVQKCAQKYGAWVVLKGAKSLVSSPDGKIWVNLTGNPGMATGGAGDVLTGTIAGLVAQTRDAGHATQLGVYLHGLAGDLAFAKLGNGLVARDIAAHLPVALTDIKKREVETINGRLRRLA